MPYFVAVYTERGGPPQVGTVAVAVLETPYPTREAAQAAAMATCGERPWQVFAAPDPHTAAQRAGGSGARLRTPYTEANE